MSFPVRTLSGVCEISTASFLISSMPKAHEGESGAIEVVVQFKYQGQSYIVDSLKAEMYLLYQSQDIMTDAVELNVNGDTAIGSMPAEFMPRAGCPLLIIKLTDPTTTREIVACHVPIHVDNVLGRVVITTRPPTPSEIVYVGRAPYIGENGNWYTFDNKTSSFVDTGLEARGPQGPTGPAGGVTGVKIGDASFAPNASGVVDMSTMIAPDATQLNGKPADQYATADAVSHLSKQIGDLSGTITDAWQANKPYAAGTYCIHGNTLYACKAEHSSGSTFDPMYWTATTVSNLIAETNNRIDLKAHIYGYLGQNIIQFEVDNNNLYVQVVNGGIVSLYNVVLTKIS